MLVNDKSPEMCLKAIILHHVFCELEPQEAPKFCFFCVIVAKRDFLALD